MAVMLAYTLVFFRIALCLAENPFEQFGIKAPGPLPYYLAGNGSQISRPDLEARSLISERQTCNYPYGSCSNSGLCCPGTAICCPSVCGDPTWGSCCKDGQCGADRPYCCNNEGCLTASDECCIGGWCPSPFRCVGVGVNLDLACCTDLQCTVYLDMEGTATVTRTVSQGLGGTTARATVTSVDDYTMTNYDYTAGGSYRTYDTTLYWSYWTYYYTRLSFATTSTRRTSTTITRTTYLTCLATDFSDASLTFFSMSLDLPTPLSAEIMIPETPTAGATVFGECSTTVISSEVTSSCETEVVGRSGGSSGGGSSTSRAERTICDAVAWMFGISAVVMGGLMVSL